MATVESNGRNGYRPIRDYAIIGDCHGSALIAKDGGIDWCCFGRHDGQPTFCRLLDAEKGGFWSIEPLADAKLERRYRPRTNILETVFKTAHGRICVRDFMPVGRHVDNGPHDYVQLNAPFWLVRRIIGLSGSVEVLVTYRPSAGFDRLSVPLAAEQDTVRGEDCPTLFSHLPFEVTHDVARCHLRVEEGAQHDLVLAARTAADHHPLDRVQEVETVTDAFWREWLAYNRYSGPHRKAVRRSALTLKLLTYAPSGALIAAASTSLPESLGGVRNWDYRYSWLRDSCFTLYALAGIGYGGEARRYVDYLSRCIRRTLPRAQIMYGIDSETELTEQQHDALEGYLGSRPVRTGNGAYDQRQIDIYGQVLDLALLYERLGGRLGRQDRRLLHAFAALVEAEWRQPDQGLWEMRGPALDHVHGKLMCWVAADRAAQLGLGDADHWGRLATQIKKAIDERGTAAEGHLLQAFDRIGVDAATLLAPMLGFPIGDASLERTIAAVEAELKHGRYLDRYQGEDGLEGEEGAFLICSFWLVDALLALGQFEKAESLFTEIVDCANEVGLFAEEIDPPSGAFLGNFPQAFTHLALIGSAVNLELARGNGRTALRGSYADRAQRSVHAVYGWRGIWAAMRTCGRVGRVFGSARSVLLWP